MRFAPREPYQAIDAALSIEAMSREAFIGELIANRPPRAWHGCAPCLSGAETPECGAGGPLVLRDERPSAAPAAPSFCAANAEN